MNFVSKLRGDLGGTGDVQVTWYIWGTYLLPKFLTYALVIYDQN
jgi:hypothetical protein